MAEKMLATDETLARLVDAVSAGGAAVTAAAQAQAALAGVNEAIENIPAGATPIVNDLTTGGATMALSAEQGKVLGNKQKWQTNPNLLDNWYFAGAEIWAKAGSSHSTQTGADVKIFNVDTKLENPIKNGLGTHYYFVIDGEERAIQMVYCYQKSGTFPINQRGNASYSGAGYGIDMWHSANGDVMITADGLIFKNSKTYSAYAEHRIENIDQYIGKITTLSILTNTGLSSATGRFGNDSISLPIGNGARIRTDSGLAIIVSMPAGAQSDTVIAVKLELGSEQTLAHQENGEWVLNEIPDYGTELAKCQRYFVRYNYNQYQAIATSTSDTAYISIPIALPEQMRTVPSIVSTCNIRRSADSLDIAIGVNGINGAQLVAGMPHNGNAIASTIYAATRGYIDFSSEL